jgi:hypothetical protein
MTSSHRLLGSHNMYQLVVVVVVYLLLATSQSSGEERPEGLVMFPRGSRQVLERGSNLTITCTYDYEDDSDKEFNNITWTLPDALAKNNLVVS